MTAILNYFLGWKGYAAIALACLLAGSAGTWRIMSWREEAQEARIVTKTIKQIEYRDRVSEKVVTKYVQVQAEDAAHTQSVIEEIPVHVTPEISLGYPLPCGFGRVFNDAWHGPVPDPAACPDGAPSDTDLATVAKAEAENAGKYDAVAHELMTLQDWVREQRAVEK